jgi:hypothetical protein
MCLSFLHPLQQQLYKPRAVTLVRFAFSLHNALMCFELHTYEVQTVPSRMVTFPSYKGHGSFSYQFMLCDFRVWYVMREYQAKREGRWSQLFPPLMARQSLVGLGHFTVEVSRSHSDTLQSVGLLLMNDRPVVEISIWQNTTPSWDRHPRPWQNSNPESQQANGRRPTPLDRPAIGIGNHSLDNILLSKVLHVSV